MRTVRRIYFYAVSLVSLEIALWGAVSLARNIFAPEYRLQNSDLLASGLALVLVGLPIFVLHWWLAQRDAARDDDEHASRVRGIFFYGVLLATLIPVVQSVLAIVARLLLSALGQAAVQAVIGGEQTAVDNLISIVVNGVVYVYFLRQLAADWRADLPGSTLAEERRLYRTIWVIYGLLLFTAGVRLLVYYILSLDMAAMLGNGLALALVGAPVWLFNWLTWQRAAAQPAERRSMLRLAVLYLLSLSGMLVALASAADVVQNLLERLLDTAALASAVPGARGWSTFLPDTTGAIATLVPAGLVWMYYSRQLAADLAAIADEPRRAALRRGYTYILALIGNTATFFGVLAIVQFIIRQFFSTANSPLAQFHLLTNGLTAVLIGLPLWLAHWLRAQREAARPDDLGDHARRSTLRKGYLYLALFATVVGSMVTAGWLLYLVFQQLLGENLPNFTLNALNWLAALILALVWLFYHQHALRVDGALALRSLGDRHAAFPVLILQEEDERFTGELVQALQRAAPRLPIVVHRAAAGAPPDELLRSRAVVLPGAQAVRPADSLREWLNEFTGERVLVPLPAEGLVWLGSASRDVRELAQETAQALRQLAEGQEVRPAQTTNPWAVTAAVLGGVFGLFLLLMLIFGLVASFG